MAGLRIFVSSTCYDFSLLRSQLRVFLHSLGYEPIMSDYEDVLYDPREHTHTSCIDEVRNCDILILIIGSRFGGKATIESLNRIDFDKLKTENVKVDALKEDANFSVTQLEVLKAIELGMPVYTFIDKKVWHDHKLYEKNKGIGFIEKIIFPSIEKQETAKYIFEFINFVRLRTRGNNVFSFEKGQDIEDILKKQWASYFQRLLNEQRFITDERKRMELLSEQFEDLKTAILSSIENVDQREVARGIVRFRRMFDFLYALKKVDHVYLKTTNDTWETILKRADIVQVIGADEIDDDYSMRMRARMYLICNDGSFFEVRLSKEGFAELSLEWNSFVALGSKSKEIIVETLYENSRGIPNVRYVRENFAHFIEKRHNKYGEQFTLNNVLDEVDS